MAILTYITFSIVIINVCIVCGEECQQQSRPIVREENNTYQQLVTSLLAMSDPIVPANADDVSNPVNINVTMNIGILNDLRMKDQELRFNAHFEVTWYDKRLAWDRDVYPVDRVFMPPCEVWFPQLAIVNSMLPPDQMLKSGLKLSVHSNGLVFWSPGGSFITTCPTDIRLYPFDTQTCVILLETWYQPEHHINSSRADINVYDPSTPEWDIVHASSEFHWIPPEDKEGVIKIIAYKLILKRKWLFYTLNVLLPVMLVSVLNSVVFALPVECGEKMSVSLTTFLTLAVFMTLIQDSLPSNSDTVCYLVLYLATQMVLSVVAVLVTAARVACHYHHSESIPSASNGIDLASSTRVQEGESSIKRSTSALKNRDWQRTGVLLDRVFLRVYIILDLLSFVAYLLSIAV